MNEDTEKDVEHELKMRRFFAARCDRKNAQAGRRARFDIDLFIVHPTIDPADITDALGFQPSRASRVGDRAKTPKGTLLSFNHRDTRWRYRRRHTTTGQWFVKKLEEFITCLEPHKSFLRTLRSTGGTAEVGVQFLGDSYFGDTLPHELLQRFVELKLDLGIEAFIVPQRP